MSASSTQTSGLHLRTVTAADTEAICSLLGAGLPEVGMTPAMYRWLYSDNPFGPPTNVVWAQGSRIVAHAGMFTLPGQRDGEDILFARTSHAATARDYRGRGLFGALVRRQRELLRDDIDLIVGLPTASAAPGLEGAGVAQRDRAERWFRPRADHFKDLARLPRPLAATLTRVAFGPAPEADGAPRSAPPDDIDEIRSEEDGIRASAAWWRWRFVDHPTRSYDYHVQRRGGSLRAAIATTVAPYLGAPFLHVLHWQAADEDAAAGVLGAAIAHAEDHVGVTLLATDGSRSAEWARRCGMRRLPGLLDDTSGPIAIAAAHPGRSLPAHGWAVSLAAHPHL